MADQSTSSSWAGCKIDTCTEQQNSAEIERKIEKYKYFRQLETKDQDRKSNFDGTRLKPGNQPPAIDNLLR
jgi:hypothetical protein